MRLRASVSRLALAWLVSLHTLLVVEARAATGPLFVSPVNPRYFTDGSGRAIYLTGSHNWYSLQDSGEVGQPVTHTLNYSKYLDLLQTNHHNFIRLWSYEGWEGNATPTYYQPLPFRRTGPDKALDGHPKFDLNQFDRQYFESLRLRTIAARERGIYVSIMLFDGWSIQTKKGNPWPGHPFNKANNVNGLDGDANGNGEGEEIHTLVNPAVTRFQESYVRKVIETVNDLDNVLYEIANESTGSKEWQYYFVRYIKQIERLKPKQHPVGLTVGWPTGLDNAELFDSPADWISPNSSGGYQTNPPPADGKKVILVDTDHLWGEGGDYRWVWKSFCRGLNPIYMDRLATLTRDPAGEIPEAPDARKAMGVSRLLAERMNLVAMIPHGDLASSGYCLENPGREYLVYLGANSDTEVDLTGAKSQLVIEWIHPIDGTKTSGASVAGASKRTFHAPFANALLHIRAN